MAFRPTPSEETPPATRLAGLRQGHGLSPLPSVPPAPAPGPPLTIASWNVHKCVGTDRRFDPARVAEVIAEIRPDILALQEADRRFGRRVGLLDLPALEAQGLRLLPGSRLPDGHGWHGNALLVRHGHLRELQRLALPGAEPRGALLAELDLPFGPLRVIGAHLGLLRASRARQCARLLEAIAARPAMPTLLMGDLNEWRPGRRSSLRGLEPVFGPTCLAPAAFSPASFPARMPVLALDRILGWPRGLVSDLRAHRSPITRQASDHLPLVASLHPVAPDLAGGAMLAAE